MIGHIIGNYKILERIGEGGMGTVYKGVDQMLEREVAVKVLRADLAHRTDIAERFRSEAVTLARVNHPNVATLYSFLREGDEFFMIMEFVRGRPLDELIKQNGALPLEQAVRWFEQALDGIHHAHCLGIVHRDLKPANVMITDAGMVKVMDFGIARVLGEARMTRTGHLIGTLEYMSPEQIRGQDVDARSDIYALGILLYEMLTGQVPFQADSDYDLMRAQIEQSPRAPGLLMPHLPASVEQVVLRALEKDPARRFQTAAVFREALEAAVGASARSTTPSIPVPAPPTRFIEAPELAIKSSVEEVLEVPKVSVGDRTAEVSAEAFLNVPLADVVEETAADEEVVVEASAEETLDVPTAEAPVEEAPEVLAEATAEEGAAPAVDEPAPLAEKLPRTTRVASGIEASAVLPKVTRPAVAPGASAPPRRRLAPTPVEPEPPVVEPRSLPLMQRLNAKHYAGAATVLILLVVGVLVVLRPGGSAQVEERGADPTEEIAGEQGSGEGNDALQQETGGQPPGLGDPAWLQGARPAQIDADIPGMLAQARQYFEANQLTTPAGENAQEMSLKVLQLDTDHAEAVELLQQIAQRYAALGDTQMESGETDEAIGQYQKGLAVAQSHPGALDGLVADLQRRLDDAEARLAAARLAEEKIVPPVADPTEPVRTGTLRVVVRPFGDIYIEDQRKARETNQVYSETLPEGTYRVRAVHKSFGSWEKEITVRAGQPQEVLFNFNVQYRLTVTSVPANAEILVDGQSTGRFTPSVVQLRPGQHTIEVRKQGFKRGQQPLTVERHAREPLHFSLQRQ